MNKKPVMEDERTVAVENAAASVTLKVISWMLIIDLLLHGLAPAKIDLNGFPVDLLFICLVSGVVNLFYKWRQQSVPTGMVKVIVVIVAASALVSFAVALLITKFKTLF